MTDDEDDSELERRVLVLAPTARDASITRELLASAGISTLACSSLDEVCREISRGAGAAVITAEAILADKDGVLTTQIQSQPPWSDLPLIVLTSPGIESPKLLQTIEAVGSMTLMKRPVQVSTIVSAVRGALRDRQRQYEVRDLLAERVRGEAKIRASEERFRALVTATSDVVYRASPDWSEMWYLTGRDLVPDTGKSSTSWMDRYIPVEDQRLVARAIAAAVRDRTTFELEHPVLRKDGSIAWTLSRAVPLVNDKGEIREWFGMARDVTERKAAEEALRDSDRKKDDFIALLAHELRNPLAPVRSGLQVLRISPDQNARERAQSMMDRQLTHMVRLIDDLLDVSRISRNKMELRRERISLSDALNTAAEAVRPMIESAGHSLEIELPMEPIFVDADLTRLSQVFANLLTNSAKYTKRGGQIKLAARTEGSEVVIAVIDNGIGIPADSLGKIFDMFSQVDRSIERATGGLGIGLALVARLVEMHGGSVKAESEGVDKGSTFTVRLPTVIEDTVQSQISKEDEPSPCCNARRILVVDDNADGAESLAMVLSFSGHTTRIAHSGQEAIEMIESFKPEIVFLDIGLPGMNGYEVAHRLRADESLNGLVLVALTGWGTEDDKRKAKEAGFNHHLTKPVDISAVDNVLTKVELKRCA